MEFMELSSLWITNLRLRIYKLLFSGIYGCLVIKALQNLWIKDLRCLVTKVLRNLWITDLRFIITDLGKFTCLFFYLLFFFEIKLVYF